MHRVDREKVREILHDYKKECYQYEHSEAHESVERDTRRLVEDVLTQNFHFHLHKPVNPESAEILSMIENYTREAVLPPVVSKLTERIVLLEKRQEAVVNAMGKLAALMEDD